LDTLGGDGLRLVLEVSGGAAVVGGAILLLLVVTVEGPGSRAVSSRVGREKGLRHTLQHAFETTPGLKRAFGLEAKSQETPLLTEPSTDDSHTKIDLKESKRRGLGACYSVVVVIVFSCAVTYKTKRLMCACGRSGRWLPAVSGRRILQAALQTPHSLVPTAKFIGEFSAAPKACSNKLFSMFPRFIIS